MYSIFTPLQFHLVCRDLANDNTLAFFDFYSSLAVLYGVVRLIGARKHKRLFIFPFQVLGISLSLSLSGRDCLPIRRHFIANSIC